MPHSHRKAPRRAAAWLAAAAGLLLAVAGCIDQQAFQQAMRQAAAGLQQELHQANGGGEADSTRRQLKLFGQRVDVASEPGTPLDSLLALLAQDVGIDPDEGTVQRAIWRVRVMKLNLATARQSLDNAREEIFGLAATAEERRALAALDARIDSADAAGRDELVAARRTFQDEAIERSKADGRLEERRLSGEQAGRVGLLLYNLGVGAVCDHLAIRHGGRVVHDFERVKHDLFDAGGGTGAMAWLSLGAYGPEFLRVPADVGAIVAEAPQQLAALGAMISTIGVLKRNNAISTPQDLPAIEGAEELESF